MHSYKLTKLYLSKIRSSSYGTWNHTKLQIMARSNVWVSLRIDKILRRACRNVLTIRTINCQYHGVGHLQLTELGGDNLSMLIGSGDSSSGVVVVSDSSSLLLSVTTDLTSSSLPLTGMVMGLLIRLTLLTLSTSSDLIARSRQHLDHQGLNCKPNKNRKCHLKNNEIPSLPSYNVNFFIQFRTVTKQ